MTNTLYGGIVQKNKKTPLMRGQTNDTNTSTQKDYKKKERKEQEKLH